MNVFNRFASRGDEVEDQGGGSDLANLILEKIAAHEAANEESTKETVVHGGGAPEDSIEMNPKVVQVYSTYAALFYLVLRTRLTLCQDWTSSVAL